MGRLTDGLNALIAKSNEVTGGADTTITGAVNTLAEGYGKGGGVGEDTSALLDAIGVESREDTGMANGLAIALTDSATEQMWSGERTTADGEPIKDGVAFVSTLKGKTMKVAQLLPVPPKSSGSHNGINFTYEDGEVIADGTASATSFSNNANALGFTAVKAVKEHIIFAPANINSTTGVRLQLFADSTIEGLSNIEIPFNAKGIGKIVYEPTTGYYSTRIRIGSGIQVSNARFPWMLFDLTDMFGAGNEPTTPDEFANAFGYATIEDMPYIPYQETNLQSFAPNAVVSKGRNMIDQDDFFGAVSGWTKDSEGVWSGSIVNVHRKYSSLDQCYRLPNNQLTLSIEVMPIQRDEKLWLQVYYADGTTSSVNKYLGMNEWGKLMLVTDTAKELVGVSLSYNFGGMIKAKNFQAERGSVATPYVPYIAPSRLSFDLTTIVDSQGAPLFPDGELKSAGSVCDMVDYANNVAEKRMKLTKMIDINWDTTTYNGKQVFIAILNEAKRQGACVCSKYAYGGKTRPAIVANDKQIGISTEVYCVMCYDSSYTTLAEFKASLSDNVFIYELATPIEGEAPLTKSFYPVQMNGSEEAITDTIVPMNAEIRYRVDTESLLTQSASLLRYSNEVTGTNDTSLGNAVKTLTDSYK